MLSQCWEMSLFFQGVVMADDTLQITEFHTGGINIEF